MNKHFQAAEVTQYVACLFTFTKHTGDFQASMVLLLILSGTYPPFLSYFHSHLIYSQVDTANSVQISTEQS